MKPTACDREAVALLACAALSAEAAAATERHLAACPACRGYFHELSALCADHTGAARRLPMAAVSPRLRARVAAATRSERRGGPEGGLAGLSLRWVQAAVAVAAIALGLLLADSGAGLLRRPLPPVAVASRTAPPPSLKATPEAAGSQLMTYRLALNRSPEEFDRLLAREAIRPVADPTTSFRPGWARLDPSGQWD